MPFTFLFLPEHRLLVRRAVGRLTNEELIGAVRATAQFALDARVQHQICELDPECTLEITPAGMHDAIAAAQEITLDLKGFNQATIAHNDFSFGIGRMCGQMMGKLNLNVEVVRSLPEAFKFLGLPPIDLTGRDFAPTSSLTALAHAAKS
jgi:hypothetical protein